MFLLSVIVVGGLVGLGAKAHAGCTKPPCAGVKWYSGSCICCTTGSEIFNFTALGVPGWFVKNCPVITGPDGKPQQADCLKCSVYGTVDTGNGLCDPLTLDPDCAVTGTAFCVNHGGNASSAQGQPFTTTNVMFGSGDFSNCNKAGKCTGTIQVVGDLSAIECQNPNWTAIGFTASEYNGQCCSCDNGYDSTGQCCADATRTFDSTGASFCTSPGQPTCSEPFHCAIKNVPNPGNAQPYQCCALSDVDPTTGECP
jgi:hypothetical protein